jgi:hypothetical protein
MCIALMGGMERLGIELRLFNTSQTDIQPRLKGVDLVYIFTGRVSHRLRNEAMKAAKAHNIPVVMEQGCGLCTFRESIACLGCRLGTVPSHQLGENCHA